MFAQLPKPSFGTIERLENFASKFVQPRNIDVWLPEGYSRAKKYNVIYMHDGQMLFDSTITWNKQEWQVDEKVHGLITNQQITDCIVVGIWNNGEYRHAEYFPEKAIRFIQNDSIKNQLIIKGLKGKPLADRYLKFIVEELKPEIDKRYTTLTGREHTLIAGSSMGGLISMYAACEYPSVFGKAACISTHWPGSLLLNSSEIPNAFFQYLSSSIPPANSTQFYFDYGTVNLDQHYKKHQLVVDQLFMQKGYNSKNYLSLEFQGADHRETDWSKRLETPLKFLMGLK